VPGRKTDVRDCDWLAELLAHGLIRASFPPAGIRVLRDLTRHRKSLLRDRVKTTNRIHRLLEMANIKLATVVMDITGVSGLAMLRALADRERDPERLAALGRGSLIRKKASLVEALRGRFSTHHAFLLKQLLAQLDHFAALIDACDVQIATAAEPVQAHIERLQTIVGVDPRSA
jgi:transposase